MVIGITGGVGCGKSAVMKIMKEQFHAKILMADDLGHYVMEPGKRAYKQICQTFGASVIRGDGKIDRTVLAECVYEDDKKREQLNAIIHPCVKEEIKKQLDEWKNESIVCLETAIMFETECDKFCDVIWCVMTDKEIRIRRLMADREYPRSKAEAIMKVQLPDEELRRRCDKVIMNNGDLQMLSERLQELLVTC